MNEEIFSRVFPNEYVLKHVRNNQRIDGRNLHEFRKVVIEKSKRSIIQ